MTPEEQARLLEELEKDIERLHALYNQYFMGIEKLEPTIQKKNVERKIQFLRHERLHSSVLRFRMQTQIQKFNTQANYWRRICRQIEEGTYERHVARAKARTKQRARTAVSDGLGPLDDFDLSVDIDMPDDEHETPTYDLGNLEDFDIDEPFARLTQDPTAPAPPSGSMAPPPGRETAATIPKLEAVDSPFEDTFVKRMIQQAKPEAPPKPLPLRPSEPPQVLAPAKRIAPAKPVSPVKPAAPSPALAPAKPVSPVPVSPVKPTAPSPSLAPAKPLAPVRPVSRTERLAERHETQGLTSLLKSSSSSPASNAVATPAPRPQRPSPEPLAPIALGAKTPSPSPTAASFDEARAKEVFKTYLEARKKTNEPTDGLTFERVARTLRQQWESKGGNLEFKIVIRDNKAIIKTVKKGEE